MGEICTWLRDSAGGVVQGRGGGERRGASPSPLTGYPLLNTDAGPHSSVFSVSIRAPASIKELECSLNEHINGMGLHIKHDMLLKNSIRAQLCRGTSV